MTEAAFAEQARKIAAMPPSNSAVSLFKYLFIAPATVAVIDKAGRVNVPKELREFANQWDINLKHQGFWEVSSSPP